MCHILKILSISALLLSLLGCGMLDEFAKTQLTLEEIEKIALNQAREKICVSGNISVDLQMFPQTKPPRLYLANDLNENDKAIFEQSGVHLSRILEETDRSVLKKTRGSSGVIEVELERMMGSNYPRAVKLKVKVNDKICRYETSRDIMDFYLKHLKRISCDDPMVLIRSIREMLEKQIEKLEVESSAALPGGATFGDSVDIDAGDFGGHVVVSSELEIGLDPDNIVEKVLMARAKFEWAKLLRKEMVLLEEQIQSYIDSRPKPRIVLSKLRSFSKWVVFQTRSSTRIETLLATMPHTDCTSTGSFSINGAGDLLVELKLLGRKFYLLEGADNLNAFKDIKRKKL